MRSNLYLEGAIALLTGAMLGLAVRVALRWFR